MIWAKSRPSHTIVGNSLLGAAGLMMLASVVSDSITLANGNYSAMLHRAIVLLAVADIVCVHQFIYRRGVARWIAVAIAAPSLFIIPDVMQRAPYVWHIAK